jgi:hypothetical protein
MLKQACHNTAAHKQHSSVAAHLLHQLLPQPPHPPDI